MSPSWNYTAFHNDSSHLFRISTLSVTQVSTLQLSGVNSRFFSVIPLSRFSLKMSRFFCVGYFEMEKMRFMHSAQRKVELRRLGNQLPVLGKANSLCKIVKFCMFCLFVKLRHIPGYRSSGKIRIDVLKYNRIDKYLVIRRGTHKTRENYT